MITLTSTRASRLVADRYLCQSTGHVQVKSVQCAAFAALAARSRTKSSPAW
jgi:hypothetical protein